ncbi:MAG: glycoside hydrolase domain-containing protein, partial [Planctomycetota bacterium]
MRNQAHTSVHSQEGAVYEIGFTSRAEFEAAWPHILVVKSKKAPLTLLSSPDKKLVETVKAGVRILSPLTGTFVTPEGLRYPPGALAIPDGKFLKIGPPWPDHIKSQSGALPKYAVYENGKWLPYTDKKAKEYSGKKRYCLTRARIEIELVVDGDIVDLSRIPLPLDTPIIDKRFKDRNVGYSQGAVMEVLASPEQVQAFVAAHPRDYWVFGEDRSRSIRRRDALPTHWVNAGDGMLERFQGRAQPGEFYVFQLGLYSAQQDVSPVRLRFEDLSGKRRGIAAQRLRCLSLGGTDYLGRSFTKDLVVKKGRVQALWIGVDVPADAKGTYTGSIVVAPEGDKPTTVRLTLDVEGEPVEEHGDRQEWRLSRLRWLDSTIGLDDNHVVAPYEPVRRQRRTLSILGRKVELGDDGLPARIRSFFSAGNTAIVDVPTEILARPMELVVQTDAGPVSFVPDEFVFTDEKKGRVQWRSKKHAKGLDLTIEGTMEFDGALSLRCVLHATKRTVVDDVRLHTALTPDASSYFMGLGHKGGRRPASVDWKWSRLCQDAFWMGSVNAGLKLQFKGENYRSPLVNIYYHYHPINIPESWGNDGKGGIRIRSDAGSETRIVAYSGARTLAAGQRLVFQVDGMISPMKLINTDAHWKYRYFHKYLDPTPYTESPQRLAAIG